MRAIGALGPAIRVVRRLYVVSGTGIVEQVPTYRGEGHAFL
ncbi:hypothetical protein ABZ517_22960 [Streptomyces scabiei]